VGQFSMENPGQFRVEINMRAERSGEAASD
jgi:hypothetical protein